MESSEVDAFLDEETTDSGWGDGSSSEGGRFALDEDSDSEEDEDDVGEEQYEHEDGGF